MFIRIIVEQADNAAGVQPKRNQILSKYMGSKKIDRLMDILDVVIIVQHVIEPVYDLECGDINSDGIVYRRIRK